MSTMTARDSQGKVNGVEVEQLLQLIGDIEQDSGCGRMQFRATNQWLGGGLNRSRVQEFSAGGQVDATRQQAFSLDNDEPAMLASDDTAPNPVEYVLHALAGCLTTTLVYHAAVQGIHVESVSSELEGELDLRGIFGMSEDVRKGYEQVRVRMRVDSPASVEELETLAGFSPVYDIVSGSLPVELVIEKL